MIDTRFLVAERQSSQTSLPAGFQMRPATIEDLGAAVRVMNAWSSQVLGRNKFLLDEIRREWQEPGYNLESETIIAEQFHGISLAAQAVGNHRHPCIGRSCIQRLARPFFSPIQ